MDNSPLLTLPPELRLIIYEFAITHPTPIRLGYHHRDADRGIRSSNAHTPHLLALTRTCVQIRSECNRLFFRQNAITCNIVNFPACLDHTGDPVSRKTNPFRPLTALASAIGSTNAAIEASVTFNIKEVTTEQLHHVAVDYAMADMYREGLAAGKHNPRQGSLNLRVQLCSTGKRVCKAHTPSVVIDLREPAASLAEARESFMRAVAEGKWAAYSSGRLAAFVRAMERWEIVARKVEQGL
ncbi:hypothetical protein LTR36_010988 [Oleoguttula mirabilis]|uniref:F-box domain-containing protein n=1 Tax=Oleoguttula mirabilis TaxID=1507867 RepID=A0AAV9J3V3_9PEZI|nr:hypothetical protein LTR36_010988 [Oleoguttula mirabilis]